MSDGGKPLRHRWRDAVKGEHGPKGPWARIVLLMLADWCKKNGKGRVGYRMLARQLDCHPETVRKHLARYDGTWYDRDRAKPGCRYSYQLKIPESACSSRALRATGNTLPGLNGQGARPDGAPLPVENRHHRPTTAGTHIKHIPTHKDTRPPRAKDATRPSAFATGGASYPANKPASQQQTPRTTADPDLCAECHRPKKGRSLLGRCEECASRLDRDRHSRDPQLRQREAAR